MHWNALQHETDDSGNLGGQYSLCNSCLTGFQIWHDSVLPFAQRTDQEAYCDAK